MLLQIGKAQRINLSQASVITTDSECGILIWYHFNCTNYATGIEVEHEVSCEGDTQITIYENAECYKRVLRWIENNTI